MKITSKNKIELFKQGWTQVDLNLSDNDIDKYLNGLRNLRDKAEKVQYPFRICYYPHMTSNNIAGIEAPFNKLIINDEIKNFFKKIKLGTAIQELMGWNNVYLTLARLFTMGRYNYRSQWHRDNDKWDGNVSTMPEIQVAIYLKKQDGFRIFKLDREIWSSNIKSLKETPEPSYLPLRIEDEYFSEINGTPGTLVFFAPGLIHQGNSNTERLDFHFRFSKSPPAVNKEKYQDNLFISEEKNTYFDFKFLNIYSEDYNMEKNLITNRYLSPLLISRLINSFNYYTAGFNVIRYLRNINNAKKHPWNIDLFANTIFQGFLEKNKPT